MLKRKRISALIKKANVKIFMIQKKKISCLKEEIAKIFWSSMDIGYSYSNSVGLSGGLLILWKCGNVEVISSFRGDGFLMIKVLEG